MRAGPHFPLERERVNIDLELVEDGFDALVVCVFGSGAVLMGAPPRRLADHLAGPTPAMLWHGNDGHTRALRGTVRYGDAHEFLVFQGTDPFELAQRRRYSRAPIVVPATVTPAGGDPTPCMTVDLSPGGAQLEAGPAIEPATACAVEIALPDGPAAVQGVTLPARGGALGLRFDVVGLEDRRRLARAVLDWHMGDLARTSGPEAPPAPFI
jgi:hypothetical protein